MNMNTTKVTAVVVTSLATLIVNAVLAVAIVGLFEKDTNTTINTQVAHNEVITVVAKRV
jgi:hypothetical protein